MKIKEIVQYLEIELLKLGFILHRYDAYSTNSIYLKLDYGACNSIRISDHRGYDHLSYKYEINTNFTYNGWKKDNKDFWRYRCTTSKKDIDNLIKLIVEDRQYKKCFNNYNRVIEDYKIKSKDCKGFWEKCWEVKINV